jgi:hypothetical protein
MKLPTPLLFIISYVQQTSVPSFGAVFQFCTGCGISQSSIYKVIKQKLTLASTADKK